MCPRYMYNNIVNQPCALASFVFPAVDLITVLLASTACTYVIPNLINKRAARNGRLEKTWDTVAFLRKGE